MTEENTCMVCYMQYDDNKTELVCCHKYIHIECIHRWEAMGNSTCPFCRSHNYTNSFRELPPLIRQVPINYGNRSNEYRPRVVQGRLRLERNINRPSFIERQNINRPPPLQRQDANPPAVIDAYLDIRQRRNGTVFTRNVEFNRIIQARLEQMQERQNIIRASMDELNEDFTRLQRIFNFEDEDILRNEE